MPSSDTIAAWKTERDMLRTYLSSTESLRSNLGSDGVSAGFSNRKDLSDRLNWLDMAIARAESGGAIVRGRILGLD